MMVVIAERDVAADSVCGLSSDKDLFVGLMFGVTIRSKKISDNSNLIVQS
jgi:hypothetical protein